MKYLGVDYGKKKTGLALGDEQAKVAVPFLVIEGGAATIPALLDLVHKEGIEAVVVGVPLPEEHQSKVQLEHTLEFIGELKKAVALPVYLVDEKFSSAEARRVQKEFGSKVSEDALAAMLILQAYFDEGPALCGQL